MKKIFLALLLLLCGCQGDHSSLLIKYQKEDSVKASAETFEISDEMQLAASINKALLNDEFTFTYTTNETIDLDEVIRLLSYLIPFDLKLKQTSLIDMGIKKYRVEVEYVDEDSEKVIAYVHKIIEDNVKEDMDVSEKIDFAYQYIIDHCEYDESVLERNDENASAFQIQGVLFDKKAVCSGYSRCFLLMMRFMDIPCLYVSSDVINHSFNLVYDGTYRFIDVTWDESNNRYYGLDAEEFFADGEHKMNEEYNSDYFMNFLSYIYHLN